MVNVSQESRKLRHAANVKKAACAAFL